MQPTRQPTQQPSRQPISLPSQQPSEQPTNQPTGQPTAPPSASQAASELRVSLAVGTFVCMDTTTVTLLYPGSDVSLLFACGINRYSGDYFSMCGGSSGHCINDHCGHCTKPWRCRSVFAYQLGNTGECNLSTVKWFMSTDWHKGVGFLSLTSSYHSHSLTIRRVVCHDFVVSFLWSCGLFKALFLVLHPHLRYPFNPYPDSHPLRSIYYFICMVVSMPRLANQKLWRWPLEQEQEHPLRWHNSPSKHIFSHAAILVMR